MMPPLLDDKGWFSTEIDVTSIHDDSISDQYTQSQIQRQQIKAKNYFVNGIQGNIKTTILDDASLKPFGEDDINSNKPEDNETHIVETLTEPIDNLPLQDYQAQLMLLEQQNKRRLMAERQAQAEDWQRRELNEDISRRRISTLAMPMMPSEDTATRATKRQKLQQPSGLGASGPVGGCNSNAAQVGIGPAEVSRHRYYYLAPVNLKFTHKK